MANNFARRLSGLGRPCQKCVQTASFQQLERDERKAPDLADVEDLDDVGMPLLRDRLRLDPEPCQILGLCEAARANHLQSDEAAQSLLVRLVNHAHAAVTELRQNLVTINRGKLGAADAARPVGDSPCLASGILA